MDLETNVDLGAGGNDAAGSGSTMDNGQVETPSFVDLKEDSLVKAPGFDKPVKFSELSRRQQADYTKKTQELANERKRWESEREAERVRLQNIATTLIQRQNQGGQTKKDDLIEQLRGKTYLDGATAAQLLQDIRENGFGAIQGELAKRDQIINTLFQQVLNLQKNYTSIQSDRTNQAFETKIGRFLNDLNLEPDYADLAKEIYLAYEGDDLDSEFPTILKNRVEQIERAIRARDKKKVEAAKKNPFLPGKGGQGTTGKPAGLKGFESPKETADNLWAMLQAAGGEDT